MLEIKVFHYKCTFILFLHVKICPALLITLTTNYVKAFNNLCWENTEFPNYLNVSLQFWQVQWIARPQKQRVRHKKYMSSGREFDRNHKNCALLDKFLIFGRVFVMGLRFQKSLDPSLARPLVAGIHKIQNGLRQKEKLSYIGSISS